MLKRQLLHIAPIFLALLIPLVSRETAIACTALAALAIYWVYHRKRHLLLREHEIEKGRSLGIVFYPVSVLILLLVFPMPIAVAAWAIMAFGDGFATLAGKCLNGPKIPWNPEKSIAGFLAFILFGFLGAAFFLWYLSALELNYILLLALLASFVAALVESTALKIEDNLSVPLVSGLFLYSLTFIAFPFSISLGNVLLGLLFSSVAAAIALSKQAINKRGAVIGVALSVAIFALLGLGGFLIGLAFFVIGSVATKYKQGLKAAGGLGHSKRTRSGRNVIANTVVAVYCALLAAATPHPQIFLLAFTAAVAAATSDTLSSELGQVFGKRFVMITNFRPAGPDVVNGAISFQGTAIGLAGAVAIALFSFALGLIPFGLIAVAALAGFAGMLVDSFLGATLENRQWLGNESVNFLCTLSAVIFSVTAFMVL